MKIKLEYDVLPCTLIEGYIFFRNKDYREVVKYENIKKWLNKHKPSKLIFINERWCLNEYQKIKPFFNIK